MNRSYCAIMIASILVFGIPMTGIAAQYDTPSIATAFQGEQKIAITVIAGASGAPNGFRVQWLRLTDFQANGNQWYITPDPSMGEADFVGIPTVNTWGGSLSSFSLPPSTVAIVEIGDLFDETGVITWDTRELDVDTDYVFRARAIGDGTLSPSDFSGNHIVSTKRPGGCTYTQGYWKNHEQYWPTGSLTLGMNTYSQADLLEILHQPAQGNGLVILAHQLIALELNIENGADAYDVAIARSQAHTLIGPQVIAPIGGGYLPPHTVSSIAQNLDDYNNGVIGPGHCDAVSVEPMSWSRVKATYR